jgi:hypothetical protein
VSEPIRFYFDEHVSKAVAEGLRRRALRMHDSGLSHHGIVYAPQGTPIGRIVRGLMLIHDVLRREEMKDHVEFL